jgi:FkbM family methyltransferase
MSLYQLDPCRHGKFLTNVNDTYIGRSLRTYGEWSEPEIWLFSQLVRAGDTVLEAGSNIGSHTVWLSGAVTDSGRVLAFEAARHTHQLLCANLALNECLNVYAQHAAIGARCGMVEFPLFDPRSPQNFGAASLVLGIRDQTEPVAMVTVDSLGLERLDFLKSDIEGFEPEMLKGAVDTIARCRPALFLEISPKPDIDTGSRDELVDFLAARGYACYYYMAPMYSPDNFRGHPEDIFQGGSIDLLCLPEEKWSVQGLTRAAVADTSFKLSNTGILYSFLPWSGAQIQHL